MVKQLTIEEISEFIDFSLERSGLSASIKVIMATPIDGSLSVDLMKQIMNKNQIVYGIDEQLLARICAKPMDFNGQTVEIAKGKVPTTGENGFIEWGIIETKKKHPEILDDGRVDFYSISQIVNVKKGQLIAKKIPSTEGLPGKSVSGIELPAKKGKDVYLKAGKNVILNEIKDNIYAAIDGQVVITDKGKINVFPVYEVNGDVDFSIGNIDFVGNVVIRGNVPDGFKIHAEGDITVYGNVEGAELIAKGSITIHQGLAGHHKSFVKADFNVKASYILDGDVYAGEIVEVSQSIMHSQVRAGKMVICKGLKGLIVGGKIQAGEKVTATTIGNQMATATHIEVGINPSIREEMQQIKKEKAEVLESLDKVQKGLNILERLEKSSIDLTPDKKMMKIQFINQQLIMDKKVKELKIREKEIEEKLTSFDKSSIEVFKFLYPGVKLVIGKAVKFFQQENSHMKFILDEGVIVGQSL